MHLLFQPPHFFIVLLCSWACKAQMNSDDVIWLVSLESSRNEIFASNLSSRLIKTFSMIQAFWSSSPIILILFTTNINLSENSCILPFSLILRILKSLFKFNTCVRIFLHCLDIIPSSYASLAVSLIIILVKINSKLQLEFVKNSWSFSSNLIERRIIT